MYRSLNFKIILIMVIFIVTVLCVVGTVLLNSVYNYYIEEFDTRMEDNLSEGSQLYIYLTDTLSEAKTGVFAPEMKVIMSSYSSELGIDKYRNFYILDLDGDYLDGTDSELGASLAMTPNLISALNRKTETHRVGTDYMDYAVYLSSGDNECIVYIKDTQEEMRDVNWILFSIILQSLLLGLFIAVILSFFLSKAISSPIQGLTRGVQLVASGDFSQKIDVHSHDEIGLLTQNFNRMRQVLKNTLDEVSGERSKLETVFSCLKDAVIAFSADGRVLHINNSATELFGDKYNENFNFNTLFELLVIDKKQIHPKGKKSDDGEGEVIHNIIFEKKVLEVSFGNIRYTEGSEQKEGVIAVIHDITDRYELDKAQREFVANVSHELRTPLTSIKGACETMLAHPDMDDGMKTTFLNMAVTESDRMTHIVQDLLVLSRLDNKRTRWSISGFPVNELVRHVCDVMKVDSDAHKHTLHFMPDDTLTTITADKERIEQVIINLISNSIKYTPDGGRILVSTKNLDRKIRITVKDNGIGIPKDDIDHIFERFYRVEKARTSDTGGTGLGLAIAKELVEAHGGNISIKSKPNEGSEVTIELPKVTNLQVRETHKPE